MTIAVIGAGWLGTAIASASERPVVATTRDGRRPPELAPHVEVVGFDLLASPRVPEAVAAADTWVFAIAPGRTQDRRAVYLDGPARALSSGAPRRVVWLGSTSALPDDGGDVDETCDAWPTSERGRLQREAEAAIARLADARAASWMILRLGGLYGPGRELGRLFGQGDGRDGDRRTNLVHRDDAVAATLAAIGCERTGVVHVVDDDHCTRRVMIDAARQSRGEPPIEWPGPPGPAFGKRVTNGRLRSWLGVTLRHPHHGPLATPEGRA